MAVLTLPALLGPIIGPPVGGFLVTYASWHWIFLINIPVGILGIALVLRYIRENIHEPLDREIGRYVDDDRGRHVPKPDFIAAELLQGRIRIRRFVVCIGIEERVELLEGRRHLLPDGSQRFLVDESFLLGLTRELGGILADPLKTTNVQNLRCMTTWVVVKGPPPA